MVRRALGFPVADDGYVIFPESRNTVWAPFAEDTDYWPAAKQGMVNFTVRDLDAMLDQLRAAGVQVDEKVEELEFGRFGWAIGPGGQPLRALGAARAASAHGRRVAAGRSATGCPGAPRRP